MNGPGEAEQIRLNLVFYLEDYIVSLIPGHSVLQAKQEFRVKLEG